MMEKLKLAVAAACNVFRSRPFRTKLNFKGRFVMEHWRNGELIGTHAFPNGVVNEGLNRILEVMFSDGTQIAQSSWYIGLISLASYSALADADTMASHGGWTEFTGYSQSTRVSWGQGDAASRAITNASPATFDANATGTVKGAFAVSNSTKGGTTGVLWATGLFTGGDVPVVSGDQLKITYNVSG